MGYYSAANKFGSPINLIASSAINIFVPQMARQQDVHVQFQIFRRMRNYAACLGLLIIMAAWPVSEFAIKALGQDYRPARLLIFSVIMSAGLVGVSQMHQAYLYSRDLPTKAATAVIIGTCAGLIVLAIGGLFFGTVGIAAAIFLTQIVTLSLFMRYTRIAYRLAKERLRISGSHDYFSPNQGSNVLK